MNKDLCGVLNGSSSSGVPKESTVETAVCHVEKGTKRPFFLGRLPFVLLLLLALIGLFATGFLTYRHILLESHSAGLGHSFLCKPDGKINCDAILQSEYAVLFGFVSSAALGLTGFSFVFWNVLCGLINDRVRKVAWVALVVYFFAAIGFSWYFAYLMAFVVDYICTWCIVTHVVNLLSLIVVLIFSIRHRDNFLFKEIATLAERIYFVGAGVFVALLVFAATLAAEKALQFDDLKLRYEEVVNDSAVIMATIQGSPTFDIPMASGDPVFGSPDAPYPLFFFGDFQCPACAKAEKLYKQIVQNNPTVLKLVYKNYPLSKECNNAIEAATDLHPMACRAARAAYSAFLLGGSKAFWAYGDHLFANQKTLSKMPWSDFAQELKLDVKKFEELMKPDSLSAQKVQEDVKLGLGLQIDATPRIFFQGKRLPDNLGPSYLVEAIENLIKNNHPERKDVTLKRLGR